MRARHRILTDFKCSFVTTLGKHASRHSMRLNKDPFKSDHKISGFFQVELRLHILYNKCEVKEPVAQSGLCTSVNWVNKSAAFVFLVRSAFLGTAGHPERKRNRHTHTPSGSETPTGTHMHACIQQ